MSPGEYSSQQLQTILAGMRGYSTALLSYRPIKHARKIHNCLKMKELRLSRRHPFDAERVLLLLIQRHPDCDSGIDQKGQFLKEPLKNK
jgi:hypothetical protein